MHGERQAEILPAETSPCLASSSVLDAPPSRMAGGARRWRGSGRTAPDTEMEHTADTRPEGHIGNTDVSSDAKRDAPMNDQTAVWWEAPPASGIERPACGNLSEAQRRAGVTYAEELFNPRSAAISHDTRGDISAIGQTICTQTTQKLRRDFSLIAQGNAVYWPHCMCEKDDMRIFNLLHEELSPWSASPYRRSRHPACVEEKLLLVSPTYKQVVALLREVFDITVGYSIVNLYADGNDWTEYHRDNFKAEGNRFAAHPDEEAEAHNATVGVSFGDSRELRFKHLQTGLEFSFPQHNGDVFAFTEPVNSAFQHCIPRKSPAGSVGPRISVIVWGRTNTPGIVRSH
eukprot:TRINITY_DN23060_c0_g1_i1.p1 TRINITY_DN23060_c0_g1~~TRINITY_DN23060_c0_g1_i1.p1  ORF type:complete len:376 (-),score=27.93 TRINITY_DN23060_c0_g1_i1:116-1150(-)